MHTKKTAIISKIIVFSFVLTLVGLGCRAPNQADQAAIKPVTLTYWTVYDDVGALREFAKEYQAARPYVTINIRQVRYDEFDHLFVNALADDVSPDIVSMHVRWLGQYAARLQPMPKAVQVATVRTTGSIQKKTEITVEQHAMPTLSIIRSNYVNTVGNDITIGSGIFGLPLSIDTLALYYNKTLLDQARIPTAPKTWEEFLDAVKKTTRRDASGAIVQSGVALGTGNNIDNADDMYATLFMQRGGTMIDGNRVLFANDVARNTENSIALETLRFYTDFARPTKEVYTWNDTMENAFDAFVRNKSVFYVGYAFDRSRIRARAPQMNLAVVPIPQLNPDAPMNIANYWVESVPLKSKHKDIAWDFIRFLSTPANIQKYTERTGIPSPLREHNKAQQENELIAPFATQILTAKNWYKGKNYTAAEGAINDMMAAYLAPYLPNQKQLERDANVIINAARKVQETL